ncbi:MAG: ABC transporter ATP-binding protein/permease [Lachnospiraceae bacterium]|nr:ABC transporter ATP-binding protein/permease [Lachnospiraceae bacterium]
MKEKQVKTKQTDIKTALARMIEEQGIGELAPKELKAGRHRIGPTALFDISKDGTYVKGCVFCCDGYVVSAYGPVGEISEGAGRRYASGKHDIPNAPDGPTQGLPTVFTDYLYLSLDDMENIRVDRLFASSVLTAVINGNDAYVAAFSGICMSEMTGFIKAVKTLKDGEDSGKSEGDAGETGETGEVGETGEEKIPLVKKRTIFSRVFRYFLKYRFSVITLFFLYLASALLSVAWPYLSGTVLYDKILERNDEFLADYGVAGRYMLALFILVVIIFVLRVIQTVVQILQQYLAARIAARTVRDIKQDIFSSMGDLSLRFFTSKQTGGLMTRVRSDSDRVTDFFLDGFPFLFIHSSTIIVTFVVMFRLNWQLSLLAVVLLPVLVVLSIKLKPALWTLFGKRHRAEKSMTSKVNDNLTGARVVKAFGREDEELKSFSSKSRSLMNAEVDIVRYNNRFTILYNMVAEISNIWVWIVGVLLVIDTRSIELGVLITFVGYVASLNGPMNFFSYIFRVWTDSINSAQRMLEIIDAVPDIKEADNPVRLTEPKGGIELKNVTFGYEAFRPVLKDISLKIEPGEVLGIVGRSGAGKSTLVNLISRLYDPDEGSVSIDGIDVKDLAFRDLRRSVAMVSQDTYIFMGSVADNIAYADREASRDDIIRAAKLAGAHDFISAMPDGYDTIVGAGGKDLSGGERQRLSIARAVLANPKILILDEATSAVDTKTEQIIEKSITLLAEGRTTISIAHRLSTLKNADRLIVIDGGRIVEEGTHDELYKQDGIYRKLSDLQTGFLSLEEI